jgi:hypothetical protein
MCAAGVGSGSGYAEAAARALIDVPNMTAYAIGEESPARMHGHLAALHMLVTVLVSLYLAELGVVLASVCPVLFLQYPPGFVLAWLIRARPHALLLHGLPFIVLFLWQQPPRSIACRRSWPHTDAMQASP